MKSSIQEAAPVLAALFSEFTYGSKTTESL